MEWLIELQFPESTMDEGSEIEFFKHQLAPFRSKPGNQPQQSSPDQFIVFRSGRETHLQVIFRMPKGYAPLRPFNKHL